MLLQTKSTAQIEAFVRCQARLHIVYCQLHGQSHVLAKTFKQVLTPNFFCLHVKQAKKRLRAVNLAAAQAYASALISLRAFEEIRNAVFTALYL
jgi:hypothetical protein